MHAPPPLIEDPAAYETKRFLNQQPFLKSCPLRTHPVAAACKNLSECYDYSRAKQKSAVSRRKQSISKECLRPVSAPQSNTTNLINHLKKYNNMHYDECIKAEKINVAYVTSLNPHSCPASTHSSYGDTAARQGSMITEKK